MNKRNTDSGGVSAAVYGSDNTTSGASRSYGGLFNRLRANGWLPNTRTVSASGNILKTDCIIHSYANSDITLTLPIPTTNDIGLKFTIRKLGSGGWVYITSQVANKIWDTSEITTYALGNDDSMTFIWDGIYWVTYFTNQ